MATTACESKAKNILGETYTGNNIGAKGYKPIQNYIRDTYLDDSDNLLL